MCILIARKYKTASFNAKIIHCERWRRSDSPYHDFARSVYKVSVEKEMSDACVAQLVRAVDRQLKDPGSNHGTVESVCFSTERFQIL